MRVDNNQASRAPTSGSLRLPSIEQSLTPGGVDENVLGPPSRNAYRGSLTDTVPAADAENSVVESSSSSQPAQCQNQISIQSLLQPRVGDLHSRKRSHAEFELQEEPISDVITRGLITVERAIFFFKTYVKFPWILNICDANHK